MSDPTPVERATKLVEHTAAQLKRVTDFGPYEGKEKAISAIRRELKQAEKALEDAKVEVAKADAAKALPPADPATKAPAAK